jgi:hypothetical protein
MSVLSAIYKAIKDVAPTWPGVAPEDAPRRRLTYALVTGTDYSTYAGDGRGASKKRVQVDAWAESAGDARRLSDEARAALYAAMSVGLINDNPDDYELDTKLFRASFDIEAWE